jgi:hypothetical protein
MSNSDVENISYVAVASAAYGDLTGLDQVNDGCRGGYFTLDRTAAGTTLAFPIVRIEGKIVGTTKYVELLRFTNTTVQTGTNTMLMHPDASTFGASTMAATQMSAMLLPAVWRVFSTNTSTGTVTWSLSASLIK